MTTKLTLSVDQEVIRKAKRHAKGQRKSLSQLVSNYLDFISSQARQQPEIDPDVLEASGQIPPDKIPELKDPKYRYLKEKYLGR